MLLCISLGLGSLKVGYRINYLFYTFKALLSNLERNYSITQTQWIFKTQANHENSKSHPISILSVKHWLYAAILLVLTDLWLLVVCQYKGVIGISAALPNGYLQRFLSKIWQNLYYTVWGMEDQKVIDITVLCLTQWYFHWMGFLKKNFILTIIIQGSR